MKIKLHRNFKKQYKKLKINEKNKTKERLALFRDDEFNPILNNHPIKGRYQGYRSINVAGDLRAIYKRLSIDTVAFITVDTCNNLYE